MRVNLWNDQCAGDLQPALSAAMAFARQELTLEPTEEGWRIEIFSGYVTDEGNRCGEVAFVLHRSGDVTLEGVEGDVKILRKVRK